MTQVLLEAMNQSWINNLAEDKIFTRAFIMSTPPLRGGVLQDSTGAAYVESLMVTCLHLLHPQIDAVYILICQQRQQLPDIKVGCQGVQSARSRLPVRPCRVRDCGLHGHELAFRSNV